MSVLLLGRQLTVTRTKMTEQIKCTEVNHVCNINVLNLKEILISIGGPLNRLITMRLEP